MPLAVDPLLKSVSRSFYLSLKILPAAVRPAMSVGYLLCRAADTIADTESVASAQRLAALLAFRRLFDRFPIQDRDATSFVDGLSIDAAMGSGAEARLVARLSDCLSAFNRLSRTDQALVQEIVQAVTVGMETDLRTFGAPDGTLRCLETERDLEAYLLSIGGEPGRFWSNVCRRHVAAFRSIYDEGLMSEGVAFGKGLQMVNILRDVAADAKRGRFYISRERLSAHNLTPDELLHERSTDRFLTLYHQLVDETVERLRHGLGYVRRMPKTEWRLRAAVWWPLSLGLRTLALLRRQNDPLRNKAAKITRLEVYGMVAASAAMLPANGCLKRSFDRWAATASSPMDRV